MTSAFAVAAVGSRKRIHLSTCRHARHPYLWADKFRGDERLLLASLRQSGAANWHVGCRVCCAQLDDALAAVRAEHVRRVVLAHLGLTEELQ